MEVTGKYIVLADHKFATAAEVCAPCDPSDRLGASGHDVRSSGLDACDAVVELPRESEAVD